METTCNFIVAPCGINCSVCKVFLRKQNSCAGCRIENNQKRTYCLQCPIKNCTGLMGAISKFCYECEKYPCARLKQLDKRYRIKYSTSVMENLESIKTQGLDQFLQSEQVKWQCSRCGGSICIHTGYCIHCKESGQQ